MKKVSFSFSCFFGEKARKNVEKGRKLLNLENVNLNGAVLHGMVVLKQSVCHETTCYIGCFIMTANDNILVDSAP